MSTNAWRKIRRGAVCAGLRMMVNQYRRSNDLWSAMHLGNAYLWLGMYKEAAAHFDDFNGRFPRRYSPSYEAAGVARWCLKEHAETRALWHEALHCGYSDNCQIQVPLLTYVGAVFCPSVFSLAESKALLANRVDCAESSDWMCRIGSYILDDIGADELAQPSSNDSLVEANDMERTVRFYSAIVRWERTGSLDVKTEMCALSNVTWSDYDLDGERFLGLIWNSEFFLARDIADALAKWK